MDTLYVPPPVTTATRPSTEKRLLANKAVFEAPRPVMLDKLLR